VINFRYHVVSLISVFLALAVGIILGAGPLKEAIGTQLTGQVASLRSEKDQLRSELDDTQTSLDQDETTITALAPGVLADTLKGAQVTVIEANQGLGDQFKAVSAQLTAAGAQVRGRIVLQDAWLTDSGAAARQDAAEKIASSGLPVDATLTPDRQVAQALALALTTDDDAADHGLSSTATTALHDLRDAGLISLERTPTVASTDVVVLAGPTTAPVDHTPSPSDDALDYARDREEEILTAVHAILPGTVVGGPAGEADGLVAAVRADGDLQVQISTVSAVDTLTGQVSVPMALADQVAGTIGHYGFDDGSTQAIPNLPPRVASSADDAPHAQGKG
jgi:hypothetical protein